MWVVFALCGLIVFMVYQATTYSEPFQTSKMDIFVKIVTSNDENGYLSLTQSLSSLSLLFYVCNHMYILPFQYNQIFIRNPRHLRFSQTVVCGPVAIYILPFREMNNLMTLKRLAAAIKRFSEKQKFANIRTSLQITTEQT